MKGRPFVMAVVITVAIGLVLYFGQLRFTGLSLTIVVFLSMVPAIVIGNGVHGWLRQRG